LPNIRRLATIHFEGARGRAPSHDEYIDIVSNVFLSQTSPDFGRTRGTACQRAAKRQYSPNTHEVIPLTNQAQAREEIKENHDKVTANLKVLLRGSGAVQLTCESIPRKPKGLATSGIRKQSGSRYHLQISASQRRHLLGMKPQ
jgi:hypothetical protein